MTETAAVEDPFNGGPVEQVHLSAAPLALVLLQVRFPGNVAVLEEAIAQKTLVQALAKSFPYSEAQDTFEIVLQPGREPEPHRTQQKAWKLKDSTGHWFITISPDSISLYTTKYDSRTDFLSRAKSALQTIESTVPLPAFSRLGIRYTNRVEGVERIQNLSPHLNESVKGVLRGNAIDNIEHAMSELVYRWPSDRDTLLARWGLMPAGATLDPAMPAVASRSWILDIDVSREQSLDFSESTIVAALSELSQRTYRFFRWAVTPKGLKMFDEEV